MLKNIFLRLIIPLFFYEISIFSLSIHQSFPQELQITPNVVNIGKNPLYLIENSFSIVVWSEHLKNENPSGIRGQILNNLGAKFGQELFISSSPIYFQDHPSVAMLSNGAFLVVWESMDQDGDGLGLFGQFYSDFQTRIGGEIQINNITIGDQKKPAIACSYGYYVVNWIGPNGIYMQIYDEFGASYFNQEVLISQVFENEKNSVSVDAFMTLFVLRKFINIISVWQDTASIKAKYIQYDFINKLLSQSDEIIILSSSTLLNTMNPDLTFMLSDESNIILNNTISAKFIIVWQNAYMLNMITITEIRSQIYNIWIQVNQTIYTIEKFQESFVVNTCIFNNKDIPSITSTRKYGFIVVWQSFSQDGDLNGIFGQRFDLNGVKIEEEFQINGMFKGNQNQACVGMNEMGDIVVTWISPNFNKSAISLNYQLFYMDRPQLKFRNYKTEISIENFMMDKPTKSDVKILESEFSFVVVWTDDYVYCKIFNTRQFAIKTSFTINMRNSSDAMIDSLGNDEYFVITWRNNYENYIYAQIFNLDGSPYNSYFILNEINDSTTGMIRYDPIIRKMIDPSSFLIAWTGFLNNTYNIYGRYFDNYFQGRSEFIINENSYQKVFNISFETGSNSPEILFVWISEFLNPTTNISYSMIMCSWWIIIDAQMRKKSNEITLYVSAHIMQTHPSVAVNSDWPMISIIVWSENKAMDGSDSVFAQMIDNLGSKVGNIFKVNSYDKLFQVTPSCTMSYNYILIVWSSYLQDSDGYGIFGSVYDLTGNQLLKEWKINTEYLGNQILPSIDSDLLGEIIISWYSSFSYSIKVQKIVPDYQADVSKLETIGFLLLNKFNEENSICSVFSDDGHFLIIAVANGIIQVISLDYLYIINEFQISEFEILLMEKYGDLIYVGVEEVTNNILVLNCSDFTNPFLTSFSTDTKISVIDSNNLLVNIKIYNNILYLGYHFNIYLYDITNPLKPIYLTKYEPFPNLDKYYVDISLNKYILTTVDSTNTISTIDTASLIFKNINSFKNVVLSYTTLLSQNQDYLFVGTKSGFEIYKNDNFTYNLKSLVSLSKFIKKLEISHDNNYISLSSDYGYYLFSLLDLQNPMLIKFLSVINKVSTSKLTIDNQYIFIYAKSGTILQKVILRKNFTTPFLVFYGFQNIPDITYNFLQLSPSKKYIYCVSQNGFVFTFNIQNITEHTSALPAEVNQFDLDLPFLLYVFDGNGLKINEVINNTQYNLKGSIDIIYSDYLISSDKKSIYIGSKEKTTMFKVINITDYTNPKLIASLNFSNFSGYSNLSFANDNETSIYMTAESYGIMNIDVSNPAAPFILNSTKSNSIDFNLISKIKKDIYATTNYEKINIFNMSSHKMILLSEIIPNGNQIYGIESYLETYLFVTTSTNITLIDLHNISIPVILDSIQMQISLTNPVKMITSTINDCVYLPIQVYCFYGSLSNYLYADLTVNSNSNNIQFLISLWPVNLISGNSIKLIKFPNIDSSLNWVTVDYLRFLITANPSNYIDMQNLLQPLTAIYVTNIQPQELSLDEINFLKVAGYVDNDYYITQLFNASIPINVDNPNLSAEKMLFVLNNHYNIKNYYFTTEQFLNLIPLPTINIKIQDQLNNKTQGSYITIDTEFTFYLSSYTAQSHYDTILTYSAINLPSWLEFDIRTLRFTGTPTINDLMTSNITVIIFDGYHNISDNFLLDVNYLPPLKNKNLNVQSQLESNPQVELETQIFISKNCFIDPNNGTLIYDAKMDGQILPQWIQFDDQNLLLRIIPPAQSYHKTFTITIWAKNRHFSISDDLNFEVETSWKYALTMIAQIGGPLVTLIGLIKYRTSLYNYFFKKRYIFEPETIYVNQYFEREVYFIKDDLLMATYFWKYLKTKKKIHYLRNLNSEDKIFSETLSNELISVKEDFNAVNNTDKALLLPDGTLYTVCECFLYHKMLKKNAFTKKIYEEFKKLIKRKLNNSWYKEVCSFTYYIDKNRDLKYQKFPPLLINKERVDEFLKLVLKKESIDIRVNLPIIYGMIKADALGIPRTARKWYNRIEYSRGESCFDNVYEIQEIRTQRKSSDKTYLMEVFNNEKLPYWIKFKIKYGILTFYGSPPTHDQGTFNLLIYDTTGYIIRSNYFNIVSTAPPDVNFVLPRSKRRFGLKNFASRTMNYTENTYLNNTWKSVRDKTLENLNKIKTKESREFIVEDENEIHINKVL